MRLRELRKQRNLSQKEFAKNFNIAQNTYANYEIGKTQPDIEVIKKIADFYHVSIDYLLEHETYNDLQLGYLSDDKKDAIKILVALNQLNFVKAYSYIAGLYAGQN